jgi:hypothetical protein
MARVIPAASTKLKSPAQVCKMKNYYGRCNCGEVKFVCEGEPFFTQYCHCNKCREIASMSAREQDKIGYSYTAAYLTNKFKIDEGEDNLKGFIRNNAKLMLCSNCKSLIYGISLDPDQQAGIGINANNFIFQNEAPDSFAPVRHIWYVNRIVDFNDNLPKFKDAPKEQFGSGELFE